MNDELMIDARDVHHHYRHEGVDEPVLHGVDLRVRRGEFVVIMGQSGCGKTTLLNILGLMMAPTRAELLHVAGRDAAGLSDGARARLRRETIGFVFQRFNLLPTISARKNVALPLIIRREKHDAEVDRILAEVDLTIYAHKKPGKLSVGQQQRVAIARAMIGRPDLLLADEPTGAIDSTNAQAVLELLSDFHRRLGQTIVMITHNEHLAVGADRVIQMQDGRFRD